MTPVRNILIVGGGTAGWMSAALLNRFLPPAQCAITLVESADIGTIGVGEATVPPLAAYLKAIGADEAQCMRACHASYKLGIKFLGWHPAHPAVWHPFGPVGGTIDRLPLFHHWLRALREGRLREPFQAWSLQATIGELQRAPRWPERGSEVTERGGYAYHLDAVAFAGYLAQLAQARGVRRVVDTVGAVALDERGFVRHVQTAAHGKLAADLFIDCSGFAGLIAERTLQEPWESWSDVLLCDRALALPQPGGQDMPPYTRASALSAGWEWRIPLSHRVGSGYVYSSRFLDDDAAARELAAHNGLDPAALEPRRLRMRIGRRRNFWVRNCVAIGLAAGFLEPLESTGIYLIQKGAELLLECFPDVGFDEGLAARYNARVAREFEEVRDFVLLHYLLNGRSEPFWRASREVALPASLTEALALYDATGAPGWDERPLFGETSFHAVAAGFGRLPRRVHAMSGYSDASKVDAILAQMRAQQLALAQSLPAHGAYLRALHAP